MSWDNPPEDIDVVELDPPQKGHEKCREVRLAMEAQLAAKEADDQRSLRLIAWRQTWRHFDPPDVYEAVAVANVLWQFLATGVILAPPEDGEEDE